MFLSVDFGAGFAGLGTVGYRQVKSDGTEAVARTQVGVVEIGQGCYGVNVVPDAAAVLVEWDSGGGSPVYAHEDLPGGVMDANIVKVNGIAIDGAGTVVDPWGPA